MLQGDLVIDKSKLSVKWGSANILNRTLIILNTGVMGMTVDG